MKEKLGSKEERIALWNTHMKKKKKKAMLNVQLPWRKSGGCVYHDL